MANGSGIRTPRHRAPGGRTPRVLLLTVILVIASAFGAIMLADGEPVPADHGQVGSASVTQPADDLVRARPTTTTRPSPTVSPTPTVRPPRSKPATSPSPISRFTAMEDEVTRLVNIERERAGCASVHTDERLRTAARKHSADMAANDYFSHIGRDGSSFVDRAAAAGYPRSAVASENIAYGHATAAEVLAGWMKSVGHRANILNCSAVATGVGLAYQGKRPYWTQLFGRT